MCFLRNHSMLFCIPVESVSKPVRYIGLYFLNYFLCSSSKRSLLLTNISVIRSGIRDTSTPNVHDLAAITVTTLAQVGEEHHVS